MITSYIDSDAILIMPRALRYRNYGVYVFEERGQPHHLPHAHVLLRGRRVASFAILTLTLLFEVETLPAGLIEEIQQKQQIILDIWVELNGND